MIFLDISGKNRVRDALGYALWLGGLNGPHFSENAVSETVTVNGNLLMEFFWPELN